MSYLSFPIFILLILTACSAQCEVPVLRLSTWNLEHLAASGDAGCRRRSEADYARLRHHAARLQADIVALQEVENAAAVARVFDPAVYAIEISSQPDRDLGRCRRQPDQERTMQRTGFAINRKRLADLGLTYRRLPDNAAIGLESQRWATRVALEPSGERSEPIELLSLHLKSGCSYGRLDGTVDRHQCDLLIRQRGILEEWIDARASAGERFILLGDFNRQLDQPNDGFWADIDDGAVCTWTPDPVLGRRCRSGTERPNANASLVLANAGTAFPYPFNPRYPYAVDHIVFDFATAQRIMPESYGALDYEGDDPAPSDHHPVSMSLRSNSSRTPEPRSLFLRWFAPTKVGND
jgi:endonuclease/exonuclease/phosphatase family metal-dependent hydrolase